MPQIAIDVRMVRRSGIGRYISGTVGALPKLKSAQWKYALIGYEGDQSNFSNDCNYVTTKTPIYSVSEQAVLPILAHSSDCLHSPHYNAPLLNRKKLVVTIHDLIHLRFPNHLPSKAALLYAKTMLPAVCRRADAIIAVSYHTKSDLVQMLRIDPKKITVIHHGIDSSFVNHEGALTSGERMDSPYFLYVGLLKAHKNLGVLLKAFQNLKRKLEIESLRLELIGMPDTKQSIVRDWLNQIKNDPSVSLRSNISDNELKKLYRNAVALVHPSLYEGFGFPLLEAMASKTPIITSRTASIPEVAGEDGALYFDPKSASELENCMEQVLDSEELRRQLARVGERRLPLFDWSISAQQTVQVYESVLGKN
jgi:glycosyltransferase involved in cell wall biosynthesis